MIIRGNTVGTNMSVEKIAEKIGGTGGGIAPLIVTHYLDDQGNSFASHTPIQIESYSNSGRAVFYEDDTGDLIALNSIYSENGEKYASFLKCNNIDGDWEYFVSESGYIIASRNEHKYNVYTVTLAEKNLVTSSDVFHLVSNDVLPILIYAGKFIPLSYASKKVAEFNAFQASDSKILCIKIYDDASYDVVYKDVITQEKLDEQIGDISSALDEIREYAESLINGGGSV